MKNHFEKAMEDYVKENMLVEQETVITVMDSVLNDFQHAIEDGLSPKDAYEKCMKTLDSIEKLLLKPETTKTKTNNMIKLWRQISKWNYWVAIILNVIYFICKIELHFSVSIHMFFIIDCMYILCSWVLLVSERVTFHNQIIRSNRKQILISMIINFSLFLVGFLYEWFAPYPNLGFYITFFVAAFAVTALVCSTIKKKLI